MRVLLFLGYLCLVSFLGLAVCYGKPFYAPVAEVSSEIRVPLSSLFGIVWVVSVPFLLAAVLTEFTERMLRRRKRV